ncbi:hypothetical protein F2P81_001469 [Scophthalmus maximus]|uniref:Uncharacterized protein n=1 Tax=Scophthalmus maximus TaxID=52904 RepID=A0A6A4TMW7_SCOMX|nr:hypothetical protein F2P81_001469 [Scophthalmus maximus]
MTKTTICSLSFLSATPSPPEERPCITRVRLRITDWNVIEREDGEKEQERERTQQSREGGRPQRERGCTDEQSTAPEPVYGIRLLKGAELDSEDDV